MRVISSRATFFHKKVFAVVWFGFLALAAGSMLWDVLRGVGDASAMDFVFIGFLAFLGFGIMNALVFDVADEVIDYGEYLIVRKGDHEVRVELWEILRVNDVRFVNPPRVTLRLERARKFGRDISFIPADELRRRINPFGKSAIAAELMERVDAARASRAVKVGP